MLIKTRKPSSFIRRRRNRRLTSNLAGKKHFLCIPKRLISALKAEEQKQKQNWLLGCHPLDNVYVTD